MQISRKVPKANSGQGHSTGVGGPEATLSWKGGRQTAGPGKLFPRSQGSSPSQGLGVGGTLAGVQHPPLCAPPGRQQSTISIFKLSQMLGSPLSPVPPRD